jgi:hypothetical protein
MKRFTSIALVMLASLFTAGGLQAQSHETRATVPFNFVVGNKQLPAGRYSVLSQTDGSVIIQNRDHPIAVISLLEAEDAVPPNGGAHLTFNQYGDHYFLSEIRCAWSTMNGDIPRSKLEKRARTEQASVEPARVLIAAE